MCSGLLMFVIPCIEKQEALSPSLVLVDVHACILVNAFHVQLFVIVVPHLDQRGGLCFVSIRISVVFS